MSVDRDETLMAFLLGLIVLAAIAAERFAEAARLGLGLPV